MPLTVAAAAMQAKNTSSFRRVHQGHADQSSMLKPARGPQSDFFSQQHYSKANGVYRNTATHWHLHWYVRTRGRPLISRKSSAILSRGSGRGVLAKVYTQRSVLAHREEIKPGSNHARISSSQTADESSFRRVRPLGTRPRIWEFMERNPIMNTFIFLMITVSATTDMLETEYRHLGEGAPVNVAFVIIDYVAVSIFTIEFAVRIFSCPSLKSFASSLMNWVDLLAILPSYIGYIVNSSVDGDGVLDAATTLRLLRLTRFVRVFKFAHYSSSVRIFFVAVGQSLHALAVLTLITSIAIVIFGSALYYSETSSGTVEEKSTLYALQRCGSPCFDSILSSCWTMISTLTTAGYGDAYPVTMLGKLVCGLAACVGIVVLAMPISVFEYNFNRIYVAREVCTKMMKELTAHGKHDTIDANVVREYLETKIVTGHLKPKELVVEVAARPQGSAPTPVRDFTSLSRRLSGGLLFLRNKLKAAASTEVGSTSIKALACLSPDALVKQYDGEGRGFLNEEEALMLLADIDEYHKPNDTVDTNSSVDAIQDQLQLISAHLNVLETRIIGQEYASKQAERLSCLLRPVESHAHTSFVEQVLKVNVQKAYWYAPTPPWMRDGFACGDHIERADNSMERTDQEWNIWTDLVIDGEEKELNPHSTF